MGLIGSIPTSLTNFGTTSFLKFDIRDNPMGGSIEGLLGFRTANVADCSVVATTNPSVPSSYCCPRNPSMYDASTCFFHVISRCIAACRGACCFDGNCLVDDL